MKIYHLCEDCNKEFEVFIEPDYSNSLQSHISSQTCPHCDKKNSLWLRVVKEKVTE